MALALNCMPAPISLNSGAWLVDLDVIARLHETGSGGKTADAGAGNQNFLGHENERAIITDTEYRSEKIFP
jgi:hypothetical protein